MSGIRFSIVITCYNQRDFIRPAVDSALSQPHPAKEIIVVDDASTDGSLKILQSYGESIRLVAFPKNRGAIEARNEGAACAEGAYLVYLDGDDALMPWALDVYDRLITERSPKIIFAPHLWFNGPMPQLAEADVPHEIIFSQYPNFLSKDRGVGLSASTFVIERQAFNAVGRWTPGIFHLDCQDLCTKLGIVGRMILIESPTTAFYRIHSSNSIHSVQPFLKMAHRLIARERAGEYPGGREHRFERYAWLGGVWFFWTKRAYRAGLFRDGLRLVADGYPMIAAAVFRRAFAWMAKRQPLETLALNTALGAPKVSSDVISNREK